MTNSLSVGKFLAKSTPLVALFAASLGITSQANALDIRQSQIDGCAKELVAYQVTDAASANRLCTCDVDVQANMTIGQVWEIQSYIRSQKDPTTLPYFVKMQQDSEQCRAGITLNTPVPPQQ